MHRITSHEIRVIDSHTAGEPTRLVLEGGPPLGSGTLAERAQRFRQQFDAWRAAIVNEPRGSDALVGALLCEPDRTDCRFGVIFFNNVGLLGMCGHGAMGLIASLALRGELQPGALKIDTPVGAIEAELHADTSITITNVPSYRIARTELDVRGFGRVAGDVAWSGNWFFLTEQHRWKTFALSDIEALTQFSRAVRAAANEQGFAQVDHVELMLPPSHDVPSCNFVLCPGGAYDRSPCGTGTSAKLACLAAAGKLNEGEQWVQRSIVGSDFVGRYRWLDRSAGHIVPSVTGRAHVIAEAVLRLDPDDPFCWGIRASAASAMELPHE